MNAATPDFLGRKRSTAHPRLAYTMSANKFWGILARGRGRGSSSENGVALGFHNSRNGLGAVLIVVDW